MKQANGDDFEYLWEKLDLADSYNRISAVLDLVDVLDSPEWLRILGEQWEGCDNISEHKSRLQTALDFHGACNGPALDMMNDEERQALNALPEVLTVYRGCYKANKWGMSWSLQQDIAERFPFLWRYRLQGQPILVTGSIKKSHILALKFGRNESEVITLKRPRHISTRHAIDIQRGN